MDFEDMIKKNKKMSPEAKKKAIDTYKAKNEKKYIRQYHPVTGKSYVVEAPKDKEGKRKLRMSKMDRYWRSLM